MTHRISARATPISCTCSFHIDMGFCDAIPSISPFPFRVLLQPPGTHVNRTAEQDPNREAINLPSAVQPFLTLTVLSGLLDLLIHTLRLGSMPATDRKAYSIHRCSASWPLHRFKRYRGASGGMCTRSVSNNSMNCSFCTLTCGSGYVQVQRCKRNALAIEHIRSLSLVQSA